jgi:hypothetical protein
MQPLHRHVGAAFGGESLAHRYVPSPRSQLTGADSGGAAGRGGWKGRPVVVLGQRDGVPMGLHPLVSFVARPVKHVRLATALLKASALMRSKSQARPAAPGPLLRVRVYA